MKLLGRVIINMTLNQNKAQNTKIIGKMEISKKIKPRKIKIEIDKKITEANIIEQCT